MGFVKGSLLVLDIFVCEGGDRFWGKVTFGNKDDKYEFVCLIE